MAAYVAEANKIDNSAIAIFRTCIRAQLNNSQPGDARPKFQEPARVARDVEVPAPSRLKSGRFNAGLFSQQCDGRLRHVGAADSTIQFIVRFDESGKFHVISKKKTD